MKTPTKTSEREKAWKKQEYKQKIAKQIGEASNYYSDSPLQLVAIRTSEEVAKILGTSRQNVHQIERRALYKLRAGLREYFTEWKDAA